MAPDYAVALVVGEQSPGGEGIRRPVAHRQGGQQVCGLEEEVLHRKYAEKLQVEQFLEQSASGCWKASEQEHGVKVSRAESGGVRGAAALVVGFAGRVVRRGGRVFMGRSGWAIPVVPSSTMASTLPNSVATV